MIKTAVILAAGFGSRLKNITKGKPKGFLIIDGKTIIERSIEHLLERGIDKIIIGTGYLSDMYERLAKKYPQIRCIKNEKFKDTGSMATLYNAKDMITDGFLLLESDLVYDKKGLQSLWDDSYHSIILSSPITDAGDGVYIETDENNYLVNMSKKQEELRKVYSELVGITKISYSVFKSMCCFAESTFDKEPKLDYEYALVGVSKEIKIMVKKLDGYLWGEIDDETHLKRVSDVIFPKIKEKEIYEKH